MISMSRVGGDMNLASINRLLYSLIFLSEEEIKKIDMINGALYGDDRNAWEIAEKSHGIEELYRLYAALEWAKENKEYDFNFNGIELEGNIDKKVIYDFLVRSHESLRQNLCSRKINYPDTKRHV